ncbi:hypothetical protein [Actinokineospora pegani]|uniref:hypothetical protein n=1 Tax=Actinokineospora pegani TaxID=2654637 RepID=UPI0012E9D429|nr:hypothetical protein [Actinokineospora pegani]
MPERRARPGRHRLTEAPPRFPEHDPDSAGLDDPYPAAAFPAVDPDPGWDGVNPFADTLVLPTPVLLVPDEPAGRRTPTGLAKFDLGHVPASVTAPRSWRRAAWFSVGASALVVAGMAWAAVALMSAPREPGRVDALPGLPSGVPLVVPNTTNPPGQISRPRSERSTAPSTTGQASAPPAPSPSGTADGAPVPTGSRPADPTAPTGSAGPTATTSARPAAPTRTTVHSPVLLAQETDAQAMGDRTEQYFRQVAENPAAAYELTSGSMRRAGPQAIEARYAAVERVDVQSMVIDPARGTTTATLRVTGEDGSVSTVDRRLTFTSGADPKITSERPGS